MPYSPSRADMNRFQTLRSGDYVRIAGVSPEQLEGGVEAVLLRG